MKLIEKHKRLIIIVLIALIIIGAAYYFTLGKPTGQQSTDTSSGGSSTGGSGSTPLPATSSSGSLGSYPLKWGVYNAFTKLLQNRLNQSITACKQGTTLTADGILGSKTVAAIKQSFPSIGASVETNRYVTEGQYSIIINSKPGCG